MKHCLFLCVIALSVSLAAYPDEPERRIAVTFDDLPTVAVVSDDIESQRSLTLRLLHSLNERNIPAIGFVNERGIYADGKPDDSRMDLLRTWISFGFELGNHSFSHPDLHRTPLADFQDDVLRGEIITRALLVEHDQELRFFRHPFLHTGRDLETKLKFESFLDNHGYRVAPVSIDNSEWIFARAYVLALRAGDVELGRKIGLDYVNYMMQMIAFYEDQSAQLFNRNIAHVLLVHANELNSIYFAPLADRIVDLGYEFVTLSDALNDAAYRSPDEYTGPGGITWLHRWAITRDVDREMFRGEPETPEYVRQLAEMPEHLYPSLED